MMPAWLIWTLSALVSWGLWAVLSKLLGDALSAEQSQTLSTLGLLPILVPLAFSKRANLRRASRQGLLLALLGGLVSCFGNIVYYAALARGDKVAAVVTLSALYPLVTILLAVLILRERLNLTQIAGIAMSIIAIWLFNIQSGSGFWSRTVIYAVLPIVLWGLSGFLQKVATNHLSAEAAGLVYLCSFLPVAVFLGVREPWPGSITLRTWVVVLALGFFLAFGNFAIMVAFAREGKAAVIMPLGSLYPMISVPVAVLFLGERVATREIVGIVCALISVVALSRETTTPKPQVSTGAPEEKQVATL
jgi:drug/metabolite transporter (DMT)-like permease